MAQQDDNWWEKETEQYQGTTNRAKTDSSADMNIIKSSDLPGSAGPPMSPGMKAFAVPVPSRPPPPIPLSPSHISVSENTSGTNTPSQLPSATRITSAPSVGSIMSGTADEDDSDNEDGKSSRGPAGWIECKEVGTDRSIWYNPRNMLASLTNPANGAPTGLDGRQPTLTVTEDFDEADMVDIRRNSIILAGAWDGNEDEKAFPNANGGNATASFKSARKASSATKLLGTVQSMTQYTNNLMDQSGDLPSSVPDLLRNLRDTLIAIKDALETATAEQDNRSDVEALVEFDKLSWNFKNDQVNGFRARSIRVPHQNYLYKNWHCPAYTSVWPIPPGVKAVLCTVRLPSASVGDDVMTQTRVPLNENDTAADIIREACRKFQSRLAGKDTFVESNYVLKAAGFREFMEGPRKMFTYEYIRQCLHDCVEMDFLLLLRPTPIVISPEELTKPSEEYRAKVPADTPVLSFYDYQNASMKGAEWDSLKVLPMTELALPFRVRIAGMERVTPESLPRLDGSMSHLFVRMILFHGDTVLNSKACETRGVPLSSSPRWGDFLRPGNERYKEIPLPALPRASRVAFLLYGKVYEKIELLGWVVAQLVDHMGMFLTGSVSFRMWALGVRSKEADSLKDLGFIYRATTRDNQSDANAATLTVNFDEFMLPVVAPLTEPYREPPMSAVGPELNMNKMDKTFLKQVEASANQDVLSRLDKEQSKQLWNARHSLVKNPKALPKFLQVVDWANPDHRMEAYRLMKLWAPFERPVLAMELLDIRYADYTVREYAVNCLRALSDDELQLYLLQLCQCLKFEPYHDSPLARFLIERALAAPYQVGHHFFWHLKAELASPDFCERFSVILEEYLSHAGPHARELRKQANTVHKLQRVAEMVVKLKNEAKYPDNQCMKEYHSELEKLNRDFFGPMGSFQVPLNPKSEATTLIVEKCRYMSSKKIPLWLVFNNADPSGGPIYIIFKSGDDLRQDILTLQLLRIMDKIWMEAGLDMRLKPYRCLATGVNDDGEGVGMIEVVLNSDTTSGIQLKFGGGAMGALRLDPLALFLKEHNKGSAYDKAVENFIKSCAGYCVATYVLGIGDRHNGNIMVTKDGHLFHIDFGHFLGNFKKKFGFNRERAPFVLTPEMAFVMGGAKYKDSHNFKDFKNTCCKAYNALRKHASLLEIMFMLMVSAGMPELSVVDDVTYIREKLMPEENDEKAEDSFKKEIKNSLKTVSRRIDNAIHNLKHG